MAASYNLMFINFMATNSLQSIQFFADTMPNDITDPDPNNPIFQSPSPMTVMWDYGTNNIVLNGTNPSFVTNAGSIQCFRVYPSLYGGAAMVQGTVSLPDGGGDMILDAVDVTAGQVITVTDFTLTVNLTAA